MEDEQRTTQNGWQKTAWFGCAGVIGILLLFPIFTQSRYMFLQEPMVNAARDGDMVAVNRLLNLGADVNGVEDDNGGTALISAAAEGHADVVRLLIRRGADVSQVEVYFGKGRGAESPLTAAEGHPEIIAILKNAGAMD